MFQIKVAKKIKTHILRSVFFSENNTVYNMENYDGAGQATGDNIIQRMRFSYGTTKAINTHSEYVIIIALPGQKW